MGGRKHTPGEFDWIVLDSGWRFEVYPLVRATAATVFVIDGELERRKDISKVKAKNLSRPQAERLAEKLTSARAEMNHRRAAASDWFRDEVQRIIAKATGERP